MDRFSSLPDVLLHEILSRVPLEDIVRISVVSKRFIDISISIPDLNISLEDSPCGRKHTWINSLLTLRATNAVRTRCFRLLCPKHVEQQFHVHHLQSWIDNTVLCNVQEFDLTIPKDTFLSLPPTIFSCGSLRVFKLNLLNAVFSLPMCIYSLPIPISRRNWFSPLEVLSLGGVRVSIHHRLPHNWISYFFPRLKDLNLEGMEGITNLDITSSTLECLCVSNSWHGHPEKITVSAERLVTLSVTWHRSFYSLNSYFSSQKKKELSFTIYSAPRLQNFTWRGKLAANYCFQGTFKHLQTATIGGISDNELSPYYESLSFQLLQFVSQVNSLKLEKWVFENLFKKDLLPYMVNVKNLEIQGFPNRHQKIPALAFFLGRLPNLKKLSVSSIHSIFKSKESKFDLENWESQDLEFIHVLKVAKIEITQEEFEIGLVKYLIKHAKALEKMTVILSHEEIDRPVDQIAEELIQFSKSFNEAALHFELK